MKLQPKNFNISYTWLNFQKWFGDIEVKPKKVKELHFKTLEKFMLDDEILQEFKPTEITLNELADILTGELLGKNDWYIFYIRDNTKTLRAVSAYLDSDGWLLSADAVVNPDRWNGGYRVVSRKPFETKSSDHLALSPSDTLESRVKNLEDEMERIKKFLIF